MRLYFIIYPFVYYFYFFFLLFFFQILSAFPFALFTSTYHGFALSALLMEWNSIFLHIRRLLKFAMVASNNSPSYSYNSPLELAVKVLLVLTMILCRHVLSIYLVYYMWKQRHFITGLPFWIGLSSTLVFIPVNIGLSYRIYLTDFKSRKKTGKMHQFIICNIFLMLKMSMIVFL